MWIKYILFLLIVLIAMVVGLCSYRRDEFRFQNDRTPWIKKIVLRTKGGFNEWKKTEDFWFEATSVVLVIVIGLLLLK